MLYDAQLVLLLLQLVLHFLLPLRLVLEGIHDVVELVALVLLDEDRHLLVLRYYLLLVPARNYLCRPLELFAGGHVSDDLKEHIDEVWPEVPIIRRPRILHACIRADHSSCL